MKTQFKCFKSVGVFVFLIIVGSVAFTQNKPPDKLADIRLQLIDLYGQIESLRRELLPTGGRQEKNISDLDSLRRLDDMEAELRQAISKIEELEFKIQRIAADGNNQIRDIEFQLSEITNSDQPTISLGTPLGTKVNPVASENPDTVAPVVSDLSELEKDVFDSAFEAYNRSDLETARDRFQDYLKAYPDGKFVADAYYYIGESLIVKKDWREAGKSFLNAYNQNQTSPVAPKSLLRLGETLIEFDRPVEACRILKNVGALFPNSGEAGLADSRIARLDCP